MTLTKQIDEARRALDELTTDEAELARLQTDQTAGIQALKAGGSKDFALLATLEGKRAALASMLVDQTARITEARATLVSLEDRAEVEQRLHNIKEAAARIRSTRDALHVGLNALVKSLTPELERLIQLHIVWLQLRAEWVAQAQAMGVGVTRWNGNLDSTIAMFAELEARGADVEALHWTLSFQPDVYGDLPDSLPTNTGELGYYAPFPDRVRALIDNLYAQAWGAYDQANLQPRE